MLAGQESEALCVIQPKDVSNTLETREQHVSNTFERGIVSYSLGKFSKVSALVYLL
jgi:hypothetical protein